jgi:hypothetical protein
LARDLSVAQEEKSAQEYLKFYIETQQNYYSQYNQYINDFHSAYIEFPKKAGQYYYELCGTSCMIAKPNPGTLTELSAFRVFITPEEVSICKLDAIYYISSYPSEGALKHCDDGERITLD